MSIELERTINDKELLTISNLTNLEWEFLNVDSEGSFSHGCENIGIIRYI